MVGAGFGPRFVAPVQARRKGGLPPPQHAPQAREAPYESASRQCPENSEGASGDGNDPEPARRYMQRQCEATGGTRAFDALANDSKNQGKSCRFAMASTPRHLRSVGFARVGQGPDSACGGAEREVPGLRAAGVRLRRADACRGDDPRRRASGLAAGPQGLHCARRLFRMCKSTRGCAAGVLRPARRGHGRVAWMRACLALARGPWWPARWRTWCRMAREGPGMHRRLCFQRRVSSGLSRRSPSGGADPELRGSGAPQWKAHSRSGRARRAVV